MISELKHQIDNHYQPYHELLIAQEQNFQAHLQRLTDDDKQYWFDGIKVSCLADVSQLPIKTSFDIITQQRLRPPYGIWSKGEMVFTSSGSFDGTRKIFPRSLENYYRFIVNSARGLKSHGIDQTDSILTTDSGGMFAGHVVIEDAATHFFGATRIRCNSPLPTEKLRIAEQYGVTIISGNPAKLLRMAKLQPKKLLSRPLKMVISTGGPTDDAEEIAEAFGVSKIVNYYGSSEIGNIAWSCNHGHLHVNIDLCYIEDNKYFTNLTNLPVFNYVQGEEIYFSYKGTCDCGSNLPTIDELLVPKTNRNHKD